MVAASLSLGRSISAATAVGPALLLLLPLGLLLLLLGELWVCLLALHSAKLVGLWGLSTGAVRGALLLKRESCRLDNPIRLESLDFARQGLTQNLSYYLHSWRELAENDHCLHIRRELKTSILEVGEVAQHFRYRGSRMRAGRDGRRKEST